MDLLGKHFNYDVAKESAQDDYRRETRAAGYEWDPQKRVEAFMAADKKFTEAIRFALDQFYGGVL